MNNIQVDLETVGLDSDAGIAQIGAVIFKDDFTITSKFCINLNVQQQLKMGSSHDKDTVAWWLGQKEDNPALYHSVFDNPKECKKGYMEFKYWLNANKTLNDIGYRFWCNHLLFDVPILNTFLSHYGDNLKNYVNYKGFEDFATIRNAVKRFSGDFAQIEKKIQREDEYQHNALSDAIWQTKSLEVAYDLMGIKL